MLTNINIVYIFRNFLPVMASSECRMILCAHFCAPKYPPGIILSTYQWKEGYLVILSYIYACLVLPQYPELFCYILCRPLCKLLSDTWDLLKPFYFPHPFINMYNFSISYSALQGKCGILLQLVSYLLHFRHFVAFPIYI